MKRPNTFYAVAALLLAGISTIVSCTKDDEQPVEGKTYHMTVTASKGGDNAKALTVDGTTISATWAEGETVTVYNVTKSADLTGTLAAQSSGASTTLKGTLTGTIEAGDELTLKFCSPDYAIQDGTLAYIASHCDYAEATVTVASVDGGKITANDAAFENKQAIVKFTLKNTRDRAISASALSVSVGGTIYAAVPTSASSELFVALPGISGQAVTLSAKVGSQWYNKTQANVTFVNGQYYTVTAKLEQKGILPGTFSVASGNRVHFSQGNLQATYDGIWTWAFGPSPKTWKGTGTAGASSAGSPIIPRWQTCRRQRTPRCFLWPEPFCAAAPATVRLTNEGKKLIMNQMLPDKAGPHFRRDCRTSGQRRAGVYRLRHPRHGTGPDPGESACAGT